MNPLRTINLAIIALAIAAYCVTFAKESWQAAFFFFPFAMTPLVVHAAMAAGLKGKASQWALLVATISYIAWFVYVYVDATILNPDPQSPIAFVFVGVYALPVLAVLWLVIYGFEWGYCRREGQG